MSGRKTIVVDEAEWRRLQQQAANLTHVQRDLPRLMADVREQTRRDLDRSMARFDARQAQVDQALTGLSEQARRFEADTTRRLQETSRRFREDLQRSSDRLRADTRAQVRQHAEAVQRELAEERRQRQEALALVETRVTEIQEGTARAAAAAHTWLADARRMADAILHLPHERYAPRALDALERRLATAERSAAEGMAAQMLGSAQSLFHELSDLRFDIEQRDLRWRARRSEAEEALVVVEATIGQNQSVPSPTEQGEDAVSLDVDFWSRGALARLAQEVRAQLSAVRDEDSPATEEELIRAIEQLAPEYTDRLEDIVAQAGTAAFASQLRASFADLIVGVLQESHFYRYEDSTYQGDDERDAFYARSVHGSGSEVVVQVEPVADGRAECGVRILSYDVDAESAETRESRKASIRRSLEANGFAVKGIEEEPGEPDERFRDLEALRHHRAEEQQVRLGPPAARERAT